MIRTESLVGFGVNILHAYRRIHSGGGRGSVGQFAGSSGGHRRAHLTSTSASFITFGFTKHDGD